MHSSSVPPFQCSSYSTSPVSHNSTIRISPTPKIHSFYLALLRSVILECLYRESRQLQLDPPIKTFGGDDLGINSRK